MNANAAIPSPGLETGTGHTVRRDPSWIRPWSNSQPPLGIDSKQCCEDGKPPESRRPSRGDQSRPELMSKPEKGDGKKGGQHPSAEKSESTHTQKPEN